MYGIKRVLPAMALLLLMIVPLAARMPQGALRLHVIANSDSAYDQEIKLTVRDAVLESMGPALASSYDRAQAREVLLSSGEALQKAADDALRERGITYGARLYYGGYGFPDRQYGEMVYPAGDYEALRVVLGDGEGRNWWCVMFPPLCLVDLEGAKVPVPGEGIKFESAIVKLFEES